MKKAFEEARFEIIHLNSDVIVTSGPDAGADEGVSPGDGDLG